MINKRLNSYTISYEKFKKQTQDTFEFSVLVCNAVPTLKRNIRLYEKGVVSELVKPDHYGAARELTDDEKLRTKEQLKQISFGYRSKLSKYILLSNFSFFESYVIDVLKEMIVFHGGNEAFLNNSKLWAERQFSSDSPEIEKIRRRVRRKNEPKHISQAKYAAKLLAEKNYRFPSALFSGYGAKMLLQKIANISANDIPNMLKDGLHMAFGEQQVLEFHNIREFRNKIAHGESVNLTIEQVTDMCKTLRTIALNLDQHLLRYYFISETFFD